MARLAGQLKNERSRAAAHSCLEPPPWRGAASVPAVIAPLRIPAGRRRTIVGLQKSPQGDTRRPASALCVPTTWIDDKVRNKSRTGIVLRVLAVAFVIAGARGGRGRRIERNHHLGASTGRSRPPADRTAFLPRRCATRPRQCRSPFHAPIAAPVSSTSGAHPDRCPSSPWKQGRNPVSSPRTLCITARHTPPSGLKVHGGAALRER